jgi:hypothetical protein
MSVPLIDASSGSCSAEPTLPPLDLVEEPLLAVAHLLAGGLLEILGPFFWAALICGFLFAEFAAM